MIEFLNQNAGAFSVVFSFVVMLATVCYAILTLNLVKETSRLRKVETEPNISVFLEPKEQWISLMDLVIRNNGRGAAYDVRFRIDPDFECQRGGYLSSFPFMQRIKYLAPGQILRFFLASAVEVFARKEGRAFEITVSYSGASGQNYNERFLLDFDDFKGMIQVGKPPLYKLVDTLENLQRELSHALSGFKRLNVEVWTQADLEKLREEFEREENERRKSQDKEQNPPSNPSQLG